MDGNSFLYTYHSYGRCSAGISHFGVLPNIYGMKAKGMIWLDEFDRDPYSSAKKFHPTHHYRFVSDRYHGSKEHYGFTSIFLILATIGKNT